jgi:hypothetical protein
MTTPDRVWNSVRGKTTASVALQSALFSNGFVIPLTHDFKVVVVVILVKARLFINKAD